MADDTYTSNKRLNTGASEYNALAFIIEGIIKGLVNTAIPVRVDSCTVNSKAGSMQPAGYVSVTPLIRQRSADGKGVDPVSIPQLPYFRLRAGKAAVVIDPQPGDVGFAVFAQQDISNLKQEGTEPVPAGTFRAYDMSDGFYMGGLLSAAPTTWVFLDPTDGKIEINAPEEIILHSKKITVNADESVATTAGETVDTKAGTSVSTKAGTSVSTKADTVSTTSPNIAMNGPISTFGEDGEGAGSMSINGDITLLGNMDVVGSGATVTAPEFVGHLTGDVDGLCSGAH